MALAKRMQKTATKLLKKFDERKGDERMMLVTSTADYWDDTLARWIFGVDSDVPLTGVSVSHDSSVFKDTLIGVDDKIIVITNGVEPNKSDKVKVDGSILSLIDIKPYNYTGNDLNIGFAVHLQG